MPLYVVGIEKLSRELAPRELVHRIDSDVRNPCLTGNPNCLQLAQIDSELGTAITKFVNNPKVQWPTHIARITADGHSCLLFSIYDSGADNCDSTEDVQGQAASGVWTGFEVLGKHLRQDIDAAVQVGRPITHILLLATGWNTFQTESAKNFADWAYSLSKAGGAPFNPAIVGITWQSTWGAMDGPAGSILSVFSFANKSNDADEIGFTWGNQILNRYLIPLASDEKLKVLVVGHSFGARISTAAVHGRSLLWGLTDPNNGYPAISLIALQPAFSVNRLRAEGKENFYTLKLPAVENSVSFYTASEFDKATAKGNLISGWFGKKPYVSSPQVVKALRSPDPPSFMDEFEGWRVNCKTNSDKCSEEGPIDLEKPWPACVRPPVIDATAIVRDDAVGASGAHSDVYDHAMAQLILMLSKSCRD